MIGGMVSTGQSIFASMKPLIIIFVGLAAGFFAIEFLLYIIRNVVENKQRDREVRYTTHYDVIMRVVEQHYAQSIANAFKTSKNTDELLANIDKIEANYQSLASDIGSRFIVKKGRHKKT